ncbi:MAG: hypothetical protein AAF978_02925 [Cyanobacteria bacterium P01_E01_bin.48]
MVAIPIQRYDLFLQASRLLQRYRRLALGLRPAGVEVALALQHSRDRLPWVGDAEGWSLQQVASDICDPFYTKAHRCLPVGNDGVPLVWPLFHQDARGVAQPILAQMQGTQRTEYRWMKACNGQAGIGCHAVAAHMWADTEFLDGDRDVCPLRFYDGHFPMTVDQGRQRCRFDDHPCGWQPGYPKMLQVIGSGLQAEVFRVEWTSSMWRMLVPESHPLPAYPIVVALYFGNERLQNRRNSLTPEHMCLDFGLPAWLFRQLFDLNPDSAFNRPLLEAASQDELPPTSPFTAPEGISLSAWSLPTLLPQPTGGQIVLDPEEPPQYRNSGLPAGSVTDPLTAERRRRRQLERTPAHDELLRQFRRWLRLAGLEVREDSEYFDLLAIRDGVVLLAEVKLLYSQDMGENIRELVGQLLYYERFVLAPWVEQGYEVLKAAVVDRPPLGEYIEFFSDLDIATFWLTENGEIDGDEDSLRLLRQLNVQVRPDPERLDD